MPVVDFAQRTFSSHKAAVFFKHKGIRQNMRPERESAL